MSRVLFRWFAVVVAIALSAVGLAVFPPAANAWVSGDLWDPGNIISDQQFYDEDAMSASQVQNFLEARVPTCEPERSAGPDDPIICLKDYRQTTIDRSADAYCPRPYVGASSERASTIIYKAAQACGISPKALLVTLQKENGLVTHTWPSEWRYRTAMGYGCPDTGDGCVEEYFGFQNQVWRAARQFQRYRLLPSNYNYRAGVNNDIGYHPNSSCGKKTVFIENLATAALYNYTPYVPNSAALSAIPGTGDSCSSYGNRNFWMYYREWFGPTERPTELGTQLVVSAETGEHYIVNDGKRWWLTGDVLPLYFSRLGDPVRVPEAWINSTRYIAMAFYVVREEGTSNYYVIDRNTKVPLRGCAGAQGHEWGFSCGHAIQMDSRAIDSYPTRQPLNNWVETSTGEFYYVEDAVKYRVEDPLLVSTFGVRAARPTIVVADRILSRLNEGDPVLAPSPDEAIADGQAARTSTGTALRLGEQYYQFPGKLYQLAQLDSVYGRPIVPSQFQQTAIRNASTAVDGWVYDAEAEQLYGLMSHGLIAVDGIGPDVVGATTMPATFFGSAVISGFHVEAPFFARRTSTSEVYLISGGTARNIGDGDDRDAYSVTYGVRRWTPRVSDEMVDAVPRASTQLNQGEVYRDTSLNQVWLIDGADKKWRLGSIRGFEFDADGIDRVKTPALEPYSSQGWASMGMRCGDDYYVNTQGKRHAVSEAHALEMSPGFLFFDYATTTCDALPLDPTEFMLAFQGPGGTRYTIEGGYKRAVDEGQFNDVTGGAPVIEFSPYVTSLFPEAES